MIVSAAFLLSGGFVLLPSCYSPVSFRCRFILYHVAFIWVNQAPVAAAHFIDGRADENDRECSDYDHRKRIEWVVFFEMEIEMPHDLPPMPRHQS
jgi:hypothetical protein